MSRTAMRVVAACAWYRRFTSGVSPPRITRSGTARVPDVELTGGAAQIATLESSLTQPGTVYSPSIGTGSVQQPMPERLTQSVATFSPRIQVGGAPTGVKAFPSASGFGALSLGGRGPAGTTASQRRVYLVTSLADTDTPGTFRYALEAPEPRFIIFRTGGTTVASTPLYIRNPYVTIAGQTAPGGGFCAKSSLTNYQSAVWVSTNNVIMRHLRVRMGRKTLKPSGDIGSGARSMSMNSDAPGTGEFVAYDNIIDHCSFSWGSDMNTQCNGHHVTYQYNINAECLNDSGHSGGKHSRGHNYRSDSPPPYTNSCSDHHNVYAFLQYRGPMIAAAYDVEVINNVDYWMEVYGIHMNADAHGAQADETVRLYKNYYEETPYAYALSNGYGPGTNAYVGDTILIGKRDTEGAPQLNAQGRPVVVEPADVNQLDGAGNFIFQVTNVNNINPPAIPVANVTTATQAYTEAITNYASNPNRGACIPTPDLADQLIIDKIKTKANPRPSGTALIDDPLDNFTGGTPPAGYDADGYPVLAAGTPPTDSNSDGIPDAWASANGMPANGALTTASNGYLWIENYLNELAGDSIP